MKRTVVHDDELLDVRQAAARTGRSPETVRRWIWSGRVGARKVGRKLLIRQLELDAVVGRQAEATVTLAEWYERYLQTRLRSNRGTPPRPNLVLEDRKRRAEGLGRAGR